MPIGDARRWARCWSKFWIASGRIVCPGKSTATKWSPTPWRP